MRGDEHRIRQILANLVGNAFQHTPVTAAVTVRVRTGEQAVIEVADTVPDCPKRIRLARSNAATVRIRPARVPAAVRD